MTEKLQRALTQETADSDGLPSPLSPRGRPTSHSSSDDANTPVLTNFKSPKIEILRKDHLSTMDVLDIATADPLPSAGSDSASAGHGALVGRSLSSKALTVNTALQKSTDAPAPRLLASDPSRRERLATEQKANHLEASTEQIDFLRIWIQRERQDTDTAEVRSVCRKLQTACMLRERWVYTDCHGHYPSSLISDRDICLNINIVRNALPKKSGHCVELKHGVFRVFQLRRKRRKSKSQSPRSRSNTPAEYDSDCDAEEPVEFEYERSEEPLFNVRSFGEFMKDLGFLMELITDGPARTFCYQRLQTLQAKFKLHMLLNENNEMSETKQVPHRDFYNIRKVDNHVHHSACMTQKHLLRFIKWRLKHCGGEIVYRDSERTYSLLELFKELNLSSYDLSIDTLSMHGHRDTFHRFDRFNRKYNPIGQSSLRQVFLKVDNEQKGRFLAEITKEVFEDLRESKYQYSEYRLSVYGKSPDEWDVLASWVCDHQLHCTNSRWMIQIPRLYAIYKAKGILSTFSEMLDNIFRALFEVTIDPASHPKLHLFLTLVVGFDTVDDESVHEIKAESYPEPADWDDAHNPPYIVWSYYLWANIRTLNRLREARGMNAFSYRPHAGEAGDFDHIAAAFLLAQSINHGLTLKKVPVLQYLYYLKQVGLSMSPLSNNLLFVEYDRNPFNLFFQRGLNVTLSTDDPLMIHYTKDPLIEEYAIAAQVYKLSAIDMCEIARNSVLQSGFPVADKKHWIGANYHRRGAAGNTVKQTNVPDIRLLFRDELLAEEENWILGLPPPIFPSIKLEKKLKRKKSAKRERRVSEHMNYLVAHRTKIRFNLLTEKSPNTEPAAPLPPSPKKRGRGNRYDPLGYFERAEPKQGGNHKFQIGYSAQSDDGERTENERASAEVVDLRVGAKGLVQRHFVTVSVGVVVGILATVIFQKVMARNDRRRHK